MEIVFGQYLHLCLYYGGKKKENIPRKPREKDVWHAKLTCMFVKKQKRVLKINQI